MAKNIKWKYDQDNNYLVLEEDAKAGDFIILDNKELINYIETNYKNQFIANYKASSEYQNLLKKQETLINENNQLTNKNKELDLKLENDWRLHEEEAKGLKLSAIEEYRNNANGEYQKVLRENRLLHEQVSALNNLKSNLEVEKNNEIKLYKERMENLINNQVSLSRLAVMDYKETEEYKNLLKRSEDYERLLIQRQNINVNDIGQDLEQWCKNQYDTILAPATEDTTFDKLNVAIDSRKADFLYTIYANSDKKDVVGRAVFEMKSESEATVNKRKVDAKMLEKLEQERIDMKADFGILVSELEKEQNFVMKKAAKYNNIIIIRPQILIATLQMLRLVYLSKKDIVMQALKFKRQNEIIDDFENLKNEIVDKSIHYLNKNLESIVNSAAKIHKEAENIMQYANTCINSHLNSIKNKIENFKIQKILDQIKNH